MARPRTEDIIYSVEKHLYAQWPNDGIKKVPSAHEAFSEYDGTEGETWAAQEWIGPIERQPNRNDQVGFDLRLIVFSRAQDRLAAAKYADEFVAILDDIEVDLIDRSDGSTTLGNIVFQSATATAPERDARGVRFCVVETSADVHPA